MKEKLNVDNDILLFSFRYALGRLTYAPDIVVDNIKGNIDIISTADIETYIREITECQNFGMQMDKEQWERFKEYLEKELEQRKER